MWKKGGIGSLKVKHPYVVGHESAGEVVAVGANVSGFAIGSLHIRSTLPFADSTAQETELPSSPGSLARNVIFANMA